MGKQLLLTFQILSNTLLNIWAANDDETKNRYAYIYAYHFPRLSLKRHYNIIIYTYVWSGRGIPVHSQVEKWARLVEGNNNNNNTNVLKRTRSHQHINVAVMPARNHTASSAAQPMPNTNVPNVENPIVPSHAVNLTRNPHPAAQQQPLLHLQQLQVRSNSALLRL